MMISEEFLAQDSSVFFHFYRIKRRRLCSMLIGFVRKKRNGRVRKGMQ